MKTLKIHTYRTKIIQNEYVHCNSVYVHTAAPSRAVYADVHCTYICFRNLWMGNASLFERSTRGGYSVGYSGI
jgi:hypothetical protein